LRSRGDFCEHRREVGHVYIGGAVYEVDPQVIKRIFGPHVRLEISKIVVIVYVEIADTVLRVATASGREELAAGDGEDAEELLEIFKAQKGLPSSNEISISSTCWMSKAKGAW
jgi:hypothetical protein